VVDSKANSDMIEIFIREKMGALRESLETGELCKIKAFSEISNLK